MWSHGHQPAESSLLSTNQPSILEQPSSVVIQGQQALQHFLVGQVGRPAVGRGDSGVQRVVDVGKPCRTIVIEIGQGVLAKGISGQGRLVIVCCGVQPAFSELVKPLGSFGNGEPLVFGGFWERERLEAGGRSV